MLSAGYDKTGRLPGTAGRRQYDAGAGGARAAAGQHGSRHGQPAAICCWGFNSRPPQAVPGTRQRRRPGQPLRAPPWPALRASARSSRLRPRKCDIPLTAPRPP